MIPRRVAVTMTAPTLIDCPREGRIRSIIHQTMLRETRGLSLLDDGTLESLNWFGLQGFVLRAYLWLCPLCSRKYIRQRRGSMTLLASTLSVNPRRMCQ